MTQIPKAPLYLGLAGTLPFLWSAATVLLPSLSDWTVATLGARFAGPYVGLFYGAVILSFMSGVLWGFATKLPEADAPKGYALSVLPALWVFFTHGGGAFQAGQLLILGFAAILLLDWHFWKAGVAPSWWMRLRLLITAVVILCLTIGVTQ
ncbi:DUF3429 domain-containing protein [Roseovarius rhodophyticola]|uniref:DUF3429 domain-containing protein n=1 Tax=Roseovarius rhodophyticola TaxID=3080827 RepID=A0ABZ2TH75_9RHOB|nr:DUF3429 domain-containing protein [Roseovarius sp. W115]MDV2929374.1 DUF3429 domain-containing protein [Roseovarius sp. W115]